MTQVLVFAKEAVGHEAFHEQNATYHKENEQIDDVLAVLLQIGGQGVPLSSQVADLRLWLGGDLKAGHACDVLGGGQKVLFGPLQVQS